MNTRRSPKTSKLRLWGTALASFLIFGGICAYIAYDNRLISPDDTAEELAQHKRELKIVLTESFIGGGLLGGAFGAAAVWVLGKTKASDEGLED